MQIVYANQSELHSPNSNWPISIFLAGPTPRSAKVESWRPEFIEELQYSRSEKINNATIFVPEQNKDKWQDEYIDQVEWEWNHLMAADIVVFWVPRELETMPAFTTNIEFGLMIGLDKKIVVGWPLYTPKMGYYEWHLKRTNRKFHHTIGEMIDIIDFHAELIDIRGQDEKTEYRRMNCGLYSKKISNLPSTKDFSRSTPEPNP